MITLENKDSHIWNFETKIIEIIHAATQTDDKVIISLNNEGPCLRSCNLYDVLDKICDTYDIDKDRFEIQTANIEEYHDIYNIKIVPNIWINFSKKIQTSHQAKNLSLATVGCFVGKTTWNRLLMLAWLDKFYHDQTLLTCHYDNSSFQQKSSLQLNEIMFDYPEEINSAVSFLHSCPRKISSVDMQYDKKINLGEIVSLVSELSGAYPKIFLELVCETYYNGLTFFPTEKTFRPIMQLTPMVIFGPQGFISNLQRCGFKTFSDYWDESYDDMSTADRIVAIRGVLDKLFLLDQTQLQKMYVDMLPILEHNKNHLLQLQPWELKLVGQK